MIIGSASLETSAMMLSSALMGSCHCVLFEDLSEEAIMERVKIFDPDIIYIRDSFQKSKLKLLQSSEGISTRKIEIFSDFFQLKTPKP